MYEQSCSMNGQHVQLISILAAAHCSAVANCTVPPSPHKHASPKAWNWALHFPGCNRMSSGQRNRWMKIKGKMWEQCRPFNSHNEQKLEGLFSMWDSLVQGWVEVRFPGSVNMRWKSCVLLPAAGRRTQLFHLVSMEPGAHNKVLPCTLSYIKIRH